MSKFKSLKLIYLAVINSQVLTNLISNWIYQKVATSSASNPKEWCINEYLRLYSRGGHL